MIYIYIVNYALIGCHVAHYYIIRELCALIMQNASTQKTIRSLSERQQQQSKRRNNSWGAHKCSFQSETNERSEEVRAVRFLVVFVVLIRYKWRITKFSQRSFVRHNLLAKWTFSEWLRETCFDCEFIKLWEIFCFSLEQSEMNTSTWLNNFISMAIHTCVHCLASSKITLENVP